MSGRVLKVHHDDNVIVALTNLAKGETVNYNGSQWELQENIPAKHKFVTRDLAPGDPVYMYGVLVGKARLPVKKGGLISTANIQHASSDYSIGERNTTWKQPDTSK